MIQKLGSLCGVVALVILAIMGVQQLRANTLFGSATACTDGYTCLTNLEVQGTILMDGLATAVGDLLVSGGTLNVATSNTATSTIIVGCIQTYATSTATPIKYQASTTPGVMVTQYGTCPNL